MAGKRQLEKSGASLSLVPGVKGYSDSLTTTSLAHHFRSLSIPTLLFRRFRADE
jgi:hypothetical protein